MDIFNKKNYHFVGIGGIGISAIARMLKSQGKDVTGSDSAQSEITDDLEKIGIKISIGQKAENIPGGAEVIIYTIAIPESNGEMLEARRREGEGKAVVVSYPEALGELSKQKYTIAISGTHGKTTTTAMIAHIMERAGLDPTVIVGSKMLNADVGKNDEGESNFHSGNSKYLVVEACEYRRSFLNLSPTILVITNIEPDHLDYYKDLDDIKSAFEELVNKVPKDGFIITSKEYESVKSDFDLLIPGEHNISNAKAAIKAVEKLGVDEKEAKEFLKDFKGTWRRQEYKGEKSGTVFYDDYAHHPSAIRATLKGFRDKYPDRKLIAVFEPHQQKRTKDFFDDFVSSLSTADYAFIAPIYTAREAKDDSISNKILAEAVNKNIPTKAVENTEDLKKELESLEDSKLTCVVMMGAGEVYRWTPSLL